MKPRGWRKRLKELNRAYKKDKTMLMCRAFSKDTLLIRSTNTFDTLGFNAQQWFRYVKDDNGNPVNRVEFWIATEEELKEFRFFDEMEGEDNEDSEF